MQQFARDTGKALDSKALLRLQVKSDEARIKVLKLKQQIKELWWELNAPRKLRIDTKTAQSNLTEANRKLQNFKNTGDATTSRLQSKFAGVWKSIVSNFINPVTIWIGAIVALWSAIVSSSKTALAFESAFAWVKKTIEWTDEEFKILEQNFRDLAKTIPLTFEELTAIGELWWQLNVAKEDLIEFTTVVAKLWVSTTLSTEDIATAFAQLQNVLWFSSDEFENLWSSLVALWNNSATTETQIIEFAKRIWASWKLAWLTAQEILWIWAAFASAGIKAEAGWTAIQKTLNWIIKAVSDWWDDLERFAKVSWLTAEEFAKQREDDSSEAFIAFIEWLWKSWTDWIWVLDELWLANERTTLALLATSWAGDLLRDSIDLANSSFIENTALTDEANKRFATTENQLKLVSNEWSLLSANAGTSLNKIWLPVSRFILEFTKNWVNWFKQFWIIVSNVFNNLWIGIWIAINDIIWDVEWLINASIRWINKLTWLLQKLPKIWDKFKWLQVWEISLWRVDVSEKNLKWIFEGARDVYKQSAQLKKQAVNDTKNQINQELNEQLSLLDKLKNIDEKNKDNKKKNWSNATSELKKELEKQKKAEEKTLIDIQKMREDHLNKIKKDREKLEKEDQKVLDNFAKTIERSYEKAQKEIEKTQDKIWKLNDKIADTKDKITDLEADTWASIAARSVEIGVEITTKEKEIKDAQPTTREELEELNKKQAELVALKEEQALAEANITDEERERAELIAWESETEKLLREEEEKKIAFMKEIVRLTDLKEAEYQKIQDLLKAKEIAEQQFTKITGEEIKKRWDLYIKDQIRIAQALWRSAGTTNNNTTTTNDNKTIIVNATVNNESNMNDLTKKLSI